MTCSFPSNYTTPHNRHTHHESSRCTHYPITLLATTTSCNRTRRLLRARAGNGKVCARVQIANQRPAHALICCSLSRLTAFVRAQDPIEDREHQVDSSFPTPFHVPIQVQCDHSGAIESSRQIARSVHISTASSTLHLILSLPSHSFRFTPHSRAPSLLSNTLRYVFKNPSVLRRGSFI